MEAYFQFLLLNIFLSHPIMFLVEQKISRQTVTLIY